MQMGPRGFCFRQLKRSARLTVCHSSISSSMEKTRKVSFSVSAFLLTRANLQRRVIIARINAKNYKCAKLQELF